ncbi:MAG TPA: hypothetical protein VMV19_20975 [Xanthobacteraceae bacterium]|nr:hypothetical protein [Xanthobacteraceae bacterium]
MAYLLPRTLVVLIAWGMSCVAIKKLFPDVDSAMFGITGACWVTGGVAYFGYLRKLRRDIEELERNRRYGVVRAQAPLTPAE